MKSIIFFWLIEFCGTHAVHKYKDLATENLQIRHCMYLEGNLDNIVLYLVTLQPCMEMRLQIFFFFLNPL